jgi:hypothetical protein
VTVFKDGHVFVVHHGKVPVDARGDVVLDDLPAPVLGTFWPFATGTKARLTGVVAGKRRFLQNRPAVNLADLLEANPGSDVFVRDPGKPSFRATVESVARTAPEHVPAHMSRVTGRYAPSGGVQVTVRTEAGTQPVALERIEAVVLRGDPKTEVKGEEERDAFTLHLDWEGGKPDAEAEVGMGYLQKGLRWIPSYRIEIDGEGKAAVKLQATLLNELDDLRDVTLHLVIGVPSFDFRATMDPMGLQRALAPLSAYFQTDMGAFSNGAISSNFAATQNVARGGEMRQAPPVEPNLPEEITGGKSEDLHVFTIPHVTLRRGERMVLPVSETTLPYEDAYGLDLPFSPPREVLATTTDPRARELVRLMLAPKAIHRLRIENRGTVPLTTAPALVLKKDRILGQGTMTYTAPGTTVDLAVTAAVDLRATRRDRETGRTPNALRIDKRDFTRIEMEGTITLSNSLDRPVTVRVSRWVPGPVDSVDHDGKATSVDAREEAGWLAAGDAPWGTWSWPEWWSTLNGATEITWTVTVPPGKSETVGYSWHYHWR